MNVSFALLLATLAGLSTGIGSLIGLWACRPRCAHLAIILGFSAGVMVYISFVELLATAVTRIGVINANIAFFVGIGFIAGLDLLIPHTYKEERIKGMNQPRDNAAALRRSESLEPAFTPGRSEALKRAGVLTALGIAIHNFPEGLVVFSSGISGDRSLGIVVAIAISLHNIPEGLSVFVPVFEATQSKKQAFFYSFSAGVAEPVGALLGYAILAPFLTPSLVPALLAFAGGIMVYISLDELLPAAHEYGEAHLTIVGVAAGMIVMAATLVLLD
ncbi:MAG: zinc transporter ZupT [Chloroflexota bacterium]